MYSNAFDLWVLVSDFSCSSSWTGFEFRWFDFDLLRLFFFLYVYMYVYTSSWRPSSPFQILLAAFICFPCPHRQVICYVDVWFIFSFFWLKFTLFCEKLWWFTEWLLSYGCPIFYQDCWFYLLPQSINVLQD